VTVSVHLLTWDYAVLALVAPAHDPVFVPRPADGLESFLADIARGDADDWLDRVISQRPRPVLRRVRRAERARPRPCVGVEHEYTVFEGDEVVDFKAIVHGLGLPGIRADPVDPHAYRCPWGGMVTADGIEAEIATPPVPLGRGAVDRVVSLASEGRSFLSAHLGPGFRLEGFSTHLNISIPGRGDARLARRYAETFAPALMLLLDEAGSPGLLVRPRPGRLELCGEFADDDRLRVAVAFAVSSTVASVRDPLRMRRLRVVARSVPSRQRFGYFLAPDAFGAHLYRDGRGSLLQRRSGTTVTAQDHLAACWHLCRPFGQRCLAPSELDAVERVVLGDGELPSR
jgi:hypothetical protein